MPAEAELLIERLVDGAAVLRRIAGAATAR
jgi:hypothetical protein